MKRLLILSIVEVLLTTFIHAYEYFPAVSQTNNGCPNPESTIDQCLFVKKIGD